MSEDVPTLRKQLQQLAELHASGALEDAAYREGRAKLERRLVDAVMSGGAVAANAASSATVRAPVKLLSGMAAMVLVIAAAGYWWMSSAERASGPAPAGEGASAAASQPHHAMSPQQIAEMAEKLAERLKTQPADAEGWAMLARSYTVLGRNPDAVAAYKKAVDLYGDDATLLADYADALAIQNNRSLAGEPAALIARALRLEPDNVKALSLAGTEAFDRKDYAAAVKHWDRLLQVGPPDSALVQQARGSAAEARELGHLPPPSGMQNQGGSVLSKPILRP